MSCQSSQKNLTNDQINAVHKLLDLVAERQLQDFGHITSDLKDDGTLITSCDRWSDRKIVEGRHFDVILGHFDVISSIMTSF